MGHIFSKVSFLFVFYYEIFEILMKNWRICCEFTTLYKNKTGISEIISSPLYGL